MTTPHHLHNPGPWEVSTLTAWDGLPIRYACFRPGKSTPRRVLLFLNGRTEYIEKYEYVVQELKLPSDWLLVTMDHRGQGASGGRRAHVQHYRSFAKDVAMVLEHLAGGLPYHILAHSMGGLIGLWATCHGYLRPQSLYLLSPLLGIYHPVLGHRLLGTLAFASVAMGYGERSVPVHDTSPPDFVKNTLTSSPERYQDIVASPFGFEPITFGWLHATLSAIDDISSSSLLRQLACPVTVVASSLDRIVDTKRAQRWVDLSRQCGIESSFQAYPGRHELLSERPEIYEDVISAIRECLR